MFDDNPIIVDVNSRNKKQKIFCVLCRKNNNDDSNSKIQLDCISPPGEQQLQYRCPRCKNTYQLGYEILEHEDDFESSHADEAADIELSGLQSAGSVAGLLTATDDEFKSDNNYYNKSSSKSDIKIPKYMQDSETTKVEFSEEIE